MEKRSVADLRRAFGKRVQEARHAAHLSQSQLARHLGLRSGVAVGDWERGKALPKFETFLRMCDALNQPPAFFVEGYRERPHKDPVHALHVALEANEARNAQRHLEVLHRLEHLPVEVGRSIAPEELRSALDRMRFEDAVPVAEARLRAALGHRRGGEDVERTVAREAIRQGWDAAREALRDWLQQRGRVV
jgi:transcriptional regulator with XRE-family HTH domain